MSANSNLACKPHCACFVIAKKDSEVSLVNAMNVHQERENLQMHMRLIAHLSEVTYLQGCTL